MHSPGRNCFLAFLRASTSLCFLVLALVNFSPAEERITFRDITAQAGIHFTHNNGAFGKKWLPETMGPGCAFIDYDNDGFPDIPLINGQDWPGHSKNGARGLKLSSTNGNGSFYAVTKKKV